VITHPPEAPDPAPGQGAAVWRLGLGGAPLGNLFEAMDDAQAGAVLAAALADGCRLFDTAPHYGNGLSEQRMGAVLRKLPRASYRLSSKVGRILEPEPDAPRDQHGYVGVLPYRQRWDYSAEGVRRSLRDSLLRLGLERLDTVYIHDCDAKTHEVDYPRVLHQVVQEALPALRSLQADGVVGSIGLGVNDTGVCLDVLGQADLDCVLLAGRYSLLDHSALSQLLPLCQRRGVQVTLGGVFNSGILATGVRAGGAVRFDYAAAPGAWVEKTAAIETLCDRMQVPLRAAALQFVLAHPAVGSLLIGAHSPGQWRDAVSQVQQPIPAAFWQTLRAASLIPPDAPVPHD